jgi:two-component system sensor histidine kinase KdpD
MGLRLSKAFDKEREYMHRKLFSAVSHDFKTPLASMIGSLEIHQRMKEKLTPEKKEILIEMALQEAYRLDNFVTNILDMGKLESGMVKCRLESFDLGESLRNCLVSLDNLLQGVDVRMTAVSGKLTLVTDPSLLCRAFSLVVDNAVKYGGTPCKINIIYGIYENGNYYINIIDNGKGLEEAKREKIFEKYTRFAKSDNKNAGTGLGLAICREIMGLIGGTVTVENATSGGCMFTLAFPGR